MPKLLRRILRLILVPVALVAVLALVLAVVFTQTGAGRGKLAGLVSRLASTPDRTVTLTDVAGLLSGELRVGDVVVADRDGPWLALRGVAVDWSPRSLFARRFVAERIAAAKVEVLRLPKPGEQKVEESGPFELPLDIEVRSLELPEIVLGEALAGEVATLSASGSVTADDAPVRIAATVHAERTDARRATLDTTVDFSPAENRLTLELTAAEPAGGLIAGLLKLPGSPSVEVRLSGEGPLADWRGKGSLAVDGKVVTSLAAHHLESGDGRRIAASGEGDFAGFLPEGLMPLAAGTTMFDVAATLAPDGGVALEHAVMQSDAIGVEGSGRYDPAGTSDLDVTVKAQNEPVELSFGDPGEPVVVSIRGASLEVEGEGASPAIRGSARLAAAQAAGFGATDVTADFSSPGFDVARRAGPVAVTLKAGAVGTVNPTLAPLVAGALEASADLELAPDDVTISRASVRNGQVEASVSGSLGLADASVAATFDAEVKAAALPQAGRAYLGETVRATGRLDRAGSGALGVEDLAIVSGPLQARGEASLADGELSAALSGGYEELARLSPQASGAISFSASASGAVTTPDVELTVKSDRIESAGRAITDLSLTAAGKVDPARPVADVSLSGAIEGETITGKATLRSDGGASRVEELLIEVGRNRIAGTLDLDAGFVPEGRLDISLPDIAPLAAMALETVSGDLDGAITFSRGAAAPSVEIATRTGALTRGDVSARDVTISARVTDYLRAPVISGAIRAGEVVAGGTPIRKIDISLDQQGEWTAFDGSADVMGSPASAKGRVRVADGVTTVELARASGGFRGVSASLVRATTVVVRDGTAVLDRLTLGLSGGTAEVSGSAGQSLDLRVALSGVPATLANTFAPGLGASGTVSGTVNVTGPASAPRVAYDIALRGGGVAATRDAGFGALDVTSKGAFAGNRLTFDVSAREGSGMALSGGGSVVVAGTPTLDVRVSGTVPFAFLARRLAAQGLSLTGAADVAVTVTGSASAPVIGGTVRTSGARFIHAPSGIAINDLSADVAMAGGVATIRSLRGTVSTGGTLTASGTVSTDVARGLPADLSLKLVDGRYTDGRVVTANLAGDLKVTGPLTGEPQLAGTIDLGKTVITVPEKLPTSLAALDVRHRNASAAVNRQAEAMRPAQQGGGSGGGLTLDLTVNAPQQIFIQGRGIDAEFGGSIRLVGPVSSPRAIGQFTMRRGRLSILTQRLDFTRGTLGFSGSLVPELDFAADTVSGSTTATIAVTGQASNPKFGFSSTPALPEDEVLAQIIFGRSLSNLSPVQIAQLAAAAAQLAGVGGSTTLLDSLRSQIGVDDIDIKTDAETGRTSVAVGKYLNDRTYVGVEKGEGAGSGKVRIDLSVGKGVKLRGEAADDGKAKGGIFFEREY